MWAAKHCSMLFSTALNRLRDFCCVPTLAMLVQGTFTDALTSGSCFQRNCTHTVIACIQNTHDHLFLKKFAVSLSGYDVIGMN